MNDDEHRLHKMLNDIVPEPPLTISVAAARERGRLHHGKSTHFAVGGRRAIGPAGAAVAVLAIAGGLLLSSGLKTHGSAPRAKAAITDSPRVRATRTDAPAATSSPATPSTTDASSPQGPPPIGVWGAAMTLDQPLIGSQSWFTGGAGAGYGLTSSSIIRFDPASGVVTNSHSIADLGSMPAFTFVNGAVWVAAFDETSSVIRVRELSASDLSVEADLAIASQGSSQHVAIASDTSGKALYVGSGKAIATVDVDSASVTNQLSVSTGEVGTLAAGKQGDLYVALDNDNGTVAIDRLNAVSGTILSSAPYGNWVDQIVPTDGGVWLVSHGGMEASVGFYPNDDFGNPPRASFTSVSSPSPSISVIQGAAWIGTSNGLACADPDTGAILAQGNLSLAGSFSDISAIDNEWFSYYSGDAGQGVATFNPPAACTG